MKQSQIVQYFHLTLVLYMLFGWVLQSQRMILVFLIPTTQFQWLINDNQCIFTQLEKKLLNDEKKKDDKKDEKKDEKNVEEIQHDSFVGSMLQKCNIDLSERIRETVINCCVYSSFLISYCLL